MLLRFVLVVIQHEFTQALRQVAALQALAALPDCSSKNLQLAGGADEQQLVALFYYLLTAGHINSTVTAQKLQNIAAVAFTEAKTAQSFAEYRGVLLLIVVNKLQILVEPGTTVIGSTFTMLAHVLFVKVYQKA